MSDPAASPPPDVELLDRMFGAGDWTWHEGCPAGPGQGAWHHRNACPETRVLPGPPPEQLRVEIGRRLSCAAQGCDPPHADDNQVIPWPGRAPDPDTSQVPVINHHACEWVTRTVAYSPWVPLPAPAAFKPGDRVYVVDDGLAKLRAIMREYGNEPAPNHTGVVEAVEGDDVIILFDLGESSAPCPIDQVRLGEPPADQ